MENVKINKENQNQSNPSQIRFKQPEWVFQFEGEEPIVFAWCNSPQIEDKEDNLVLTLPSTSNCLVTFRSPSGKQMKIFAREITENTLKMLEHNYEISDLDDLEIKQK
jgi:hypothetical protein